MIPNNVSSLNVSVMSEPPTCEHNFLNLKHFLTFVNYPLFCQKRYSQGK